ncbi:MAG TPA: hypothetical protein VKA30_04570 [Actinomycetota bacterium]|nr:hypothetical protein [Actinomycetota bacterium]
MERRSAGTWFGLAAALAALAALALLIGLEIVKPEPRHGWGNPWVFGAFAMAAAALLAAFIGMRFLLREPKLRIVEAEELVEWKMVPDGMLGNVPDEQRKQATADDMLWDRRSSTTALAIRNDSKTVPALQCRVQIEEIIPPVEGIVLPRYLEWIATESQEVDIPPDRERTVVLLRSWLVNRRPLPLPGGRTLDSDFSLHAGPLALATSTGFEIRVLVSCANTPKHVETRLSVRLPAGHGYAEIATVRDE